MDFQYALRLTSKKRPPIYKNTFCNFRERVREYYQENDIDLIQKEVEALADIIANHLEIEGNKAVSTGGKVIKTEEFLLLKRMLGEQNKDDKDLKYKTLQSPSDPDTTYRKIYKADIGYTANVMEVFNDNNSVTKNWDFKNNTYSDQDFSADNLEKTSNDHTLNISTDNPLKNLYGWCSLYI